MISFEEKRQARIDRLRERAAAHAHKAANLTESARRSAECIPLGEPIHIGHHSEQRDRNFRARISSRFERGREEAQVAEELERRAEAAENNNAVSSDDPEAVTKLKEKLERLEKQREMSKGINKAVRSKDPRAALVALGLKEETINNALTPDSYGNLGVPGWSLTNLGANIRRIKERIEQLEKKATTPVTPPETHGDIRIEESDNRVKIFFPSKPADDVRAKLKSFGFRWSPTEGAWQAFASNGAWFKARQIVKGCCPASPVAAALRTLTLNPNETALVVKKLPGGGWSDCAATRRWYDPRK